MSAGRSVSSLNRCLFCLYKCSYGSEVKLDIPGARGCDQLTRKLEQIFIVQKLLDVPRECCEDIVQQQKYIAFDKETSVVKKECEEGDDKSDCNWKGEEEDEGETQIEQLCVEEEQWFQVCEKCSKSFVKPAWSSYQELVAAEMKIRSIKESVRTLMEKQILQMWRNKMWCGMKGEGVDVQIRNSIFPDLLSSKKSDDKEKAPPLKEEPKPRCRRKKKEVAYIIRDSPENSFHVEEDTNTQGDIDKQENVDKQDNMEEEEDVDMQDNMDEQDEDDMDEQETAEVDWEPPENFDESPTVSDADDDPCFKPRSKSRPPKKSKAKKNNAASSTTTTPKERRKRIRKRRRLPENLKRFKCLQCCSYFHTAADLTSHQEAHEQSKQSGGGTHDCETCSYPARTLLELHHHMKKRHGRIRSHRCSKCNLRVKSWKKLQEHMTAKHTGEVTEEDLKNPKVSLKCSACSRQLNSLVSLTLHQKKMHPELYGAVYVEPVECPKCAVKFSSRIRLQYHINKEHGEKLSKWVCEECGKGFDFKCHLDRHMTKHIKNAKRDFICHLCGLDYVHQQLLSEHYRKVHPGETEAGGVKTSQSSSGEEFKCRYCDLKSPFRVVILRHQKKHKEEMGHRCAQCEKSFMTNNSLRRHVRLNHPLVPEIVPCPHCLKKFSSQDYMKHHVKNFCTLKNLEQPTPGVITAEPLTAPEDEQQLQFSNYVDRQEYLRLEINQEEVKIFVSEKTS